AKLDDPLEQLFLRNVGGRALAAPTATGDLLTEVLPDPAAIVQPGQGSQPPPKHAGMFAIPEPTLTIGPHPDRFDREAAAKLVTELAVRPGPTNATPRYAKPARPVVIQAAQAAPPNLLDRVLQWWHLVAASSTRRHSGHGMR